MSGFSWKLARKWTKGVLLEICMFSYTSNAAGKSWEVLHWLMQKYVKWWNATGNWNYFPTTFMLLNAAAVSASSYGGQEARPLCQPPRVPLCQGWDRGAAVGRAVVASGLHHQPLVPGKYLLKQLCQCFQVRKAEMFLSDSCGSFCISKTRWLFPPLIESLSFQNEKLSKLYVDI